MPSRRITIDARASKEKHQMSRINPKSMAVELPAALRPATLRAGFTLTVIAALTAFAARAQAQRQSPSAFEVRPFVGALVATGEERDVLESAVLVGGQGSYTLSSNFALVGSFGWSPSEDKTSAARPKLDLYQYDLGIQGKADDLTPGTVVSTRPYAIVGGGARTYSLRNVDNASAQTNPLGYAAVGLDLDQSGGRVGLRLEARDNVTSFKGLRGELADRKARNDLQLVAGLTFGF
jgi:hypothetical protein